MIKLHANVSKKVPIPSQEFTSQSFLAGIEVELGDGASDEQIQGRLRMLYGLLEQAVDEQIAQKASEARPAADPQPRWQPDNGNGGNGHPKNGHPRATQAQLRAIFGIAKSLNLSRESLIELIREEAHIEKPDDLTVESASQVIERLKSLQDSA